MRFSFSRSNMARASAFDCPTTVKWHITSRLHRSWIVSTKSMVFSRVLPPAPYVTEQKPGLSLLMLWISLKRLSSPFSVFGGKNSTDSVKPGRAYRSANFTQVLDDYLRRSGTNNTMLCDEQLAQNEK